MPIEGEALVVEPNYPHAEMWMRLCAGADDEGPSESGRRNTFWSRRLRSDVVIYEQGGRIRWGIVPGVHHFSHDLRTLGCADAWGLEQEERALAALADLVSERQLRQYLLTGMFLETSPRSQVSYCFRRLRPTVALRPNRDGSEMRILAALCLHPIGYYRDSWAGAMCPTDDVIAHLMLMRGDEPRFWKWANQIRPHRPEAGL